MESFLLQYKCSTTIFMSSYSFQNLFKDPCIVHVIITAVCKTKTDVLTILLIKKFYRVVLGPKS